MGDYFTLAHYQSQYAQALTLTRRLEQSLKLAREGVLYSADPEAALERLTALQAEYEAAKAKSDELWFLANTGKTPEELDLEKPQPYKPKLNFNMGRAK